MNKLLLVIGFFLSVLATENCYAQLPHCCKKKVRIKKQSKRARGALVGVKGKDDNKSLRKRERERAKAFKEEEREKRLAKKQKAKGIKDTIISNQEIPEKPKTDDERVDDLLKIFDDEQKNLEGE